MMTMRNDDEILNTTTTTTDSSTIDNYYNNTNPIQMFINKLLLNVTTEAVINIATTTTPTTPMPMPTPTPMTNSQIPINQKNNQYLLNIINNLLLTTNTINTNNTDSDIKIDSIYGLRNIGGGAGAGTGTVTRATDSDINGNTQIIYAKLTAMIVLFFASLICGLIPLRLSKIIKWFNNKNNKNRKKLNKLMPVASAAATSASASSSSSSSAHRQTQSQSTATMATTLSSSMESTTESSEMGIEEKSNQSIKDSLINYGGSGGSGAGGSNGHVRPKNQQNTDDADDDDDEEFSFNNSTGRSALIITMLFSFGGGVLLSTTFLHLLPEVIENIENLQHDGHLPEFSFPLAELLMCLGFFIMYLVEEIVHAYLHKHQTTSTSTTTTSSDSTVNSSSTINNNNNDLEQTSQLTHESSHSHHHPHHHHHHSHSSNTILTIETQKTDNSKDLTIDGSTPSSNNNNNNILIEQNNNNNTNTNTNANAHATNKSQSMIDCPVADSVSIMVTPVPDEMLSSIPAGQHHHHGHSHLPKMHPDETMIVTSLRGLLIVLALSVHELFEGLAVGLETITETVWYMFGAVAAHKLILAFCVGIELIVTKTKLWLAIVYVFTFAVVSPIGIGIGILIENLNRNALNGGLTTTTTTIGPQSTHDGHDHVSRLNSFDDDDDVHDIGFDDDATITSNIASVILQGLASGTLLYVVFFEILQKGRSGLFQYFAVLAGFSIMFGLKFLIGHEHSHHEHEH